MDRCFVCVGTVSAVGFSTPEEAALAGDRSTSATYVLASSRSDDDAAVLIMSPGWPQPDLVLCRKDDDGWTEGGSTDGGTMWSMTNEEAEQGVLVSWGDAEPGATAIRITFRGSTTIVPVENGHYVWMVDGVPHSAIDEPGESEWVF